MAHPRSPFLSMGPKQKAKLFAFFSAIVSLLSFGYKMGMGIWNMSLVLIIASISTLMVFIGKIMFVKAITNTRDKKKKAYFGIFLATLIYSLVFLLFVVLQVAGIDISNDKTYEGWLGALLIAFMLIMFILSIINLRGALEKTDLMVIGLKEITFVSALTDVVIIEEFALRIYLQYQETNTVIETVHNYVPLGIAVLMILISLFMLIRFFRYKTDTK